MIVDTSAILAIVLKEKDADIYRQALVDNADVAISAANWFEGTLRIDRPGREVGARYDDLFPALSIDIVPVTDTHARAAREAYRQFGRGNHRAGLNFGDCFAYALAKTEGRVLLFKGDDFSNTDVFAARPAS
ncbi:MAG: PIN domain-containing protein [Alphaproteobacteria bacterium]|jgi:ribonuclease VapC|nr:PIN domain-containing protein [Alphaproteobacteria bacterium]